MGNAVYHNGHRWAGYGVPSLCDSGDGIKIDRGLAYLCGDNSDHGCGRFVCEGDMTSVAFGEDGQPIPDDDPLWDDADAEVEYVSVCARCAAGEPPFEETPDLDEWVVHMLVDPSWAKWREEQALLYSGEGPSPSRLDVLVTERRHAILEALRVDRAVRNELEDRLLEFDVQAEDKRHIIQLGPKGWIIAHPLAERLGLDSLFSCKVTWSGEGEWTEGRYWLNDDGSLGADINPK